MPPIDLSAVIQTIAQFAFSLIVLLLPIIIKALYPQIEAWLAAKAKDAQWGVVVTVALDIAKIPDPGTRKAVAQAVRTLLKKYFEE